MRTFLHGLEDNGAFDDPPPILPGAAAPFPTTHGGVFSSAEEMDSSANVHDYSGWQTPLVQSPSLGASPVPTNGATDIPFMTDLDIAAPVPLVAPAQRAELLAGCTLAHISTLTGHELMVLARSLGVQAHGAKDQIIAIRRLAKNDPNLSADDVFRFREVLPMTPQQMIALSALNGISLYKLGIGPCKSQLDRARRLRAAFGVMRLNEYTFSNARKKPLRVLQQILEDTDTKGWYRDEAKNVKSVFHAVRLIGEVYEGEQSKEFSKEQAKDKFKEWSDETLTKKTYVELTHILNDWGFIPIRPDDKFHLVKAISMLVGKWPWTPDFADTYGAAPADNPVATSVESPYSFRSLKKFELSDLVQLAVDKGETNPESLTTKTRAMFRIRCLLGKEWLEYYTMENLTRKDPVQDLTKANIKTRGNDVPYNTLKELLQDMGCEPVSRKTDNARLIREYLGLEDEPQNQEEDEEDEPQDQDEEEDKAVEEAPEEAKPARTRRAAAPKAKKKKKVTKKKTKTATAPSSSSAGLPVAAPSSSSAGLPAAATTTSSSSAGLPAEPPADTSLEAIREHLKSARQSLLKAQEGISAAGALKDDEASMFARSRALFEDYMEGKCSMEDVQAAKASVESCRKRIKLLEEVTGEYDVMMRDFGVLRCAECRCPAKKGEMCVYVPCGHVVCLGCAAKENEVTCVKCKVHANVRVDLVM